MRFTIEYDMEKKEGTVVPGSFEMDEAKGVSDEERLAREGVSLYMEALADTYAGYFGEIASSFQNGELEMRLNAGKSSVMKAMKDKAYYERMESFMKEFERVFPDRTLCDVAFKKLGGLFEKTLKEDGSEKTSDPSSSVLDELASEPGNEALARYLKMSRDREEP